MKYGLLQISDINYPTIQTVAGNMFSLTVNSEIEFNKGDKILGYWSTNPKKFIMVLEVADKSTLTKVILSKIFEIPLGVEIRDSDFQTKINTGFSSNKTLLEITKEEYENYEQKLLALIGLGKTSAKPISKDIKHPHNRIIFGAPGTGKSHLLEKESKKFNQTQNLIDQFKTELKELCGPNHSMADYAAFGLKYYSNTLNTFMKGESFSKADFVPIYADCIPKEILDSGTLLDNIARVCNGCNKLGISTFITKEYQCNVERVTFHPNYSYAQFVGTYKPVSIKENGKTEISYEYVPGPFINTWIRAYKSGQPQLLLIEEINRANVAGVFGDIFQLLDRDSNGNSEYPINISNDLKRYLSEKEEINIETMIIPSNMYIWATMNSADQGVQPMDAAFKRRWDFEYLGIDDAEKNEDGSENTEFKSYILPIPYEYNSDTKKVTKYEPKNWNKIRHAINDKLKNIYGVNEDKLLGPYFLSKSTLDEAKEIKYEMKAGETKQTATDINKAERICSLFKSKVLMYLYEDVVKMNPTELFNKSVFSEDKPLHYSDLCNKFDELGLKIFDEDFIK